MFTLINSTSDYFEFFVINFGQLRRSTEWLLFHFCQPIYLFFQLKRSQCKPSNWLVLKWIVNDHLWDKLEPVSWKGCRRRLLPRPGNPIRKPPVPSPPLPVYRTANLQPSIRSCRTPSKPQPLLTLWIPKMTTKLPHNLTLSIACSSASVTTIYSPSGSILSSTSSSSPSPPSIISCSNYSGCCAINLFY